MDNLRLLKYAVMVNRQLLSEINAGIRFSFVWEQSFILSSYYYSGPDS